MTHLCPCQCGYREGAYVPPHMTYDALWRDAFQLGGVVGTYRVAREALHRYQEDEDLLKPLVNAFEKILQEKDGTVLPVACCNQDCPEFTVRYESLLPFPPTGIQCRRCLQPCKILVDARSS